MPPRVTPMVHVPDVRATIAWYQAVGFTVEETNECDGVIDWALLSFGEGRVMFNAGGKASTAERREVDLYVIVDDVDGLFERVKGTIDIRKGLYDAFHGMREFIARDLDGFWVTFGAAIAGR